MKQSSLPLPTPPALAPLHRLSRTTQKWLAQLAQHRDQQEFAALAAALEQVPAAARLDVAEQALLACWHSEALDNLGRPSDASAALHAYERNEVLRARLPALLVGLVDLRLAAAYGFSGEAHYAITLAQRALAQFTAAREGPRSKGQTNPALSRVAVYLPTPQMLVGEAQILLGRLYRTLGEASLAYSYMTQSLHTLTSEEQPVLRSQAHLSLGILLTEMGEFAAGVNAFEQAKLALGTKLLHQHPLLHGKIELNLGGLHEMRGDLRGALPHQEAAITHLTQARHARLLAMTQSNFGSALIDVGQWARAEAWLTEVLPAMRGGRHEAALSNTLSTLAGLHALRGAFPTAQEYLAQAWENVQRAQHGYGEAEVWLGQGQVFLLADDLPAAAQSFAHAQTLSRKIESHSQELVATLFRAEVACEQQDFEAAAQTLAKARAPVEKMGNWEYLAHWREVQGRVQAAQGHLIEAVTHLRQALTLWDLNGNVHRLAKAQLHLGQLLWQSGEAEAAISYLQPATATLQALPCPPLLAQLPAFRTARPPQPAIPERALLRNTALLGMLRLQAAQGRPELLQAEVLELLATECGAEQITLLAWRNEVLQPVQWRGCQEAQAHDLARQLQTQLRYWDGQWAGTTTVAPKTQVLPFGPTTQPFLLVVKPILTRTHQLMLGSWLETATQALSLQSPPARSDGADSPTFRAVSSELWPLPGVVYQSAALRQVAERIHQLRGSRVTVLITGETGTGKELIARAIHELSDRAEQPFVPVNCAALPADLMEAELFGYQKGAFTGAKADHKGLIREAAGGTLFLDELGELPKALQPKLLRFLQEHEVRGLGETHPTYVDVRIVTATNRTLEEMVARQEFREDLYYRINVLRLNLPPLRERKEDVPALLKYFLRHYRSEAHKPGCEFSPAAWQLLLDYDWPGNVRQMAHEVQRAVVLAPEYELIPPELLSEALRRPPAKRATSQATPFAKPQPRSLADGVAAVERLMIQQALTRHQHNLSATAAELDITRNTLRQKMKQFGM